MEVVHGVENIHSETGYIATIGAFDGVHPGHMKILERVSMLAQEKNFKSILITFYPHPKLIINRGMAGVKLLTTIDEKINILKNTFLDRLLIIPFDREFSQISYDCFVKDIILEKVNAKGIVVGYDHAFGNNREGDFNRLEQLAKLHNFYVEKVNPFKVNGQVISSTFLRRQLLEGDVHNTIKWLGRRYSLCGKVIKGESRGRKLGFPTANIDIDFQEKLVPDNGVYAVDAIIEKKRVKGMMNIGYKPTFSKHLERGIEVNLFDFNGMIYGKNIKVEFKKRLRDEKKFESAKELAAQLEIDKKLSLKL
jgi:riboflavin kinase/FMN adenylyltransferase